jgi:predicted permease
VAALKGGEDRGRRRLMSVLVVAQVAFCFLVHFTAGLFVATFDRLSHQPLGFDPAGVLTLETSARGDKATWAAWNEVMEAVKARPGVESAALADWALLSGNISVGGAIVNGEQLAPPPYYLSVSPGWFAAMRLPLLAGREFRPGERFPEAAIVNESFARKAFGTESPLGKYLGIDSREGLKRAQIVGVAADARYADMREAIQPTVYVPVEHEGEGKTWATIVVRAGSGKPEALAADLRAAVQRARKNFQVSNAITQLDHVRKHTVRERLVSMVSLFFAAVALILAAVGLYGVLNYSVLQRRREIGIRMALGAQPADVGRRVAAEVFGMVVVGSVVGLTLGLWSERYVETLLFNVEATDLRILATPAVMLAIAAILAAVPPILRAVRIDPAETLRAE